MAQNRWVFIMCISGDGRRMREGTFFWPVAQSHLYCDKETAEKGRPKVSLRSKDLRYFTDIGEMTKEVTRIYQLTNHTPVPIVINEIHAKNRDIREGPKQLLTAYCRICSIVLNNKLLPILCFSIVQTPKIPCKNYREGAPILYSIVLLCRGSEIYIIISFPQKKKMYSKVHVTKTLSQKVERDTSVMCGVGGDGCLCLPEGHLIGRILQIDSIQT